MWFKLFRKTIESALDSSKGKRNKLLEITLQKNLEVIGDLNIEMQKFSGRLSTLQKNIHMLDQRFDLLTDMLGIEIAADCIHDPPKAFVKSMSDKSLFASAKKYIEATITAEKTLALQYKMMKQQIELMKNINWR